MLKRLAASVIFSPLLLLAACATVPPAAAPGAGANIWTFEKDAIDLHIKADPQLNLIHNTSHTLVLCIYNLRDLRSFNELQDRKDGLQKLLECGSFDPSVVNARRMIIQPGQEVREVLDRPEGARYVNLTAGYYHMKKDGMVCSFPIYAAKQAETLPETPEKLVVDVYLGPQDIQKVQE